jgi:hypothetical protein
MSLAMRDEAAVCAASVASTVDSEGHKSELDMEQAMARQEAPVCCTLCSAVQAACVFKESCGTVDVDDLNAKDICYLSVHVEKENLNANTNKPGKTAATQYSEDAKAIAAIYNLGLMYAHGTVVEEDKAKAAELYAKAHAAGHVKATYNLGLMYQRGDGVEQDSAKAADLYEQAHAKGYSKATYNLGKMYDRGIGVEQDSAKAAALFHFLAKEKTDIGSLRTRLKKNPCKPILHINVDHRQD